ncbi:histidine kinase [Paenibacillus sp. KQZ6P-2]|uniref:Histidine kinase n=1 Tax=Paenibacillus mangrovi TaxID=2931978 RepID=A0A9X2B167_9BACL|nr:histidine kinase [Paenibacillus mangrovi]MCJ8010966.1 histidine kinase [Paenibacillus mangrovi]
MNRTSTNWRKKLIATALLCLLIPSAISLGLTGVYTNNMLMKNASMKSEQSLDVAKLYVSNIIDNMNHAFNSIQYDSEMISNLRLAWNKYNHDEHKTDFFANKVVTEKLNELMYFSGKCYVTIFLPGGLYFSNYSVYPSDLSYMYQEPWLVTMSKKPTNTTSWIGVLDNYVPADTDRYPHLITIAHTFKLYANAPNAIIVISKPESEFHEIFDKYASDQTMMLLDREGTIQSQTDERLIGTTVPFTYLSDHKDRVVWNDKEYISVTTPLSFAGLSILSLTPYQAVTGNYGKFFNQIVSFQFLSFIVFSVVMYFLLRYYIRPIITLAKTAKSVESGNLDVRSGVSGNDEIGYLGLSFDRMLDRINEMIHEIQIEQTRKRKAELELLQAQVNPHFLFNTLNSIRLKTIMRGDNEIGGVIGSLSTLLRMTINRNNEFLTLHEEIDIATQYVKLMKFRHVVDVQLITNLASDTLFASIPRLTLQPLIENAFIHGLKQKQGTITISSWRKDHLLYISIEDDGVGIEPEKLVSLTRMLSATSMRGDQGTSSSMNGIGLKNVNERLSMIYGDEFTIQLISSKDKGLQIALSFPFSKYEGMKDDVQGIVSG